MAQDQRHLYPADQITVILHRPGIPENIGSVARAMRNTGFSRLIISSPDTEDWATAEKLAVSAVDILRDAPRFRSLNEAIAHSGARFIVGATGRDRKYWENMQLFQSVPVIWQRALSGGAALIFGPENNGLSNDELTLCHLTVTIPSNEQLTSFNLAQAVLLVLFTLMNHSRPHEVDESLHQASFEKMEGMYGHIQELLAEVDFLWEDNPDHMMRAVRGYLNRTVPTEEEVKMIRGICRRLLWHLRNPETGKR